MEHGNCGENVMWWLEDNGTLTISGRGYMQFRSYWHLQNKLVEVREVVIEDGVTSISEEAFRNFENLTKVTIADSVVTIDSFAFDFCKSLREITIPNSVTSIGARAFSNCKSLTNIIIPNSVRFIGKEPFYDCASFQKIYYPAKRGFEKNLSAGNNAQLIPYKNIPPPAQIKPTPSPSSVKPTSPDKLITLGWQRDENGTMIFIPYNAPSVQKAVAEQAELIREKLLPLWWEARRYNSELRWKVEGKTLTVGGVSEIKAYSYEATPWRDSLNDIQRIIIEEGVEEISAGAFIECRRLELLTIPASVKTIGDMAFSICYCGDWRANGGRNVYWTLEDGVLNLKKNPDVCGDADFSTGAVTWLALDKNITGIKLEAGVVPKEKFFEWLGRRSNAMQIAFG